MQAVHLQGLRQRLEARWALPQRVAVAPDRRDDDAVLGVGPVVCHAFFLVFVFSFLFCRVSVVRGYWVSGARTISALAGMLVVVVVVMVVMMAVVVVCFLL